MHKPYEYQFDWDPVKARSNAKKHRVTFERAAKVFQDPSALSQFDTEHNEYEDRWITLGLDTSGIPLVVCHTFQELGPRSAGIRIISARKATRTETKQYRRA